MRLLLPANNDASLLREAASLGVVEIFGKLPSDVVGGGRPTYMSTPLAKRRLAAYVAEVHTAGLTFNYLLNSACLGNREWSYGFQRKLTRLLAWLVEIGVDSVTVVSPWLMQLVKREYPHLRVKVGIYAQIDSVQRALYWERIGADALTLESFSINRDFERLARIREAVRCELVLIANHLCLPSCPLQVAHQNAFAHASGAGRRFFLDHCLFECNRRRLLDPALIIAASWIRPEDVQRYESLGYDSFKLLERNIPTSALLKRIRAYSARRSCDNLAELLFSWGFSEHPPGFSWLHLARTSAFWRVHPRLYSTFRRFLELQGMLLRADRPLPVTVDASAIPDDFLDFFRGKRCADRDCERCGYCSAVAARAVRVNPEFLREVLPLYESLERDLVRSHRARPLAPARPPRSPAGP